jgi:nucleoside phosphorylase
VNVACTLAITAASKTAARLTGKSGVALENLEAFAVARAAAAARLPFAAILGVSNRVGPQAPAEWKTHAAAAARSACTAVLAWLALRPPVIK